MTKDNNTFDLFKNYETILHHVAACAPLILWAVDRQGIINLSEGRALESLGLKDNQLIGHSVYDVYADQPELLECIYRAQGGESLVTNVKMGGSDLEAHFTPARDTKGEMQGVIGVVIDISDHFNTLQALRKSKQRFALAQRAGQVGIWDWNIQTNELYWSENIESMFGLESGEFAGTFESFTDLIHPDDYEYVTQAISATITGNNPYRIQYRIVWPNGEIHWLYAAGEVVMDDNDIPYRMLGTVQNITERIHQEKLVLESERNLELSQELANIGSWSWALGENNVVGSKQLYILLDLDPDMSTVSILEHLVKVTHPDDLKRVEETLSEIFQNTDDTEIEFRVIRPNGSIRTLWGLGKAIVDENNNIIRRFGIAQDITEKVEADAVMRKLSYALKQTDDLVMISNQEGAIEFVNHALEITTGYTQDELIGKKPYIFQPGEHSQNFCDEMWETIQSGKSYRNILVNRRKDGTTFHEELTITPLVDNNGHVTHFVLTGKDISERVKDQQRMQYLAHHDILTELPNRVLFVDRLEHAMLRRGQSKKHLALIFLDLDRFKIINDTLGHDAGDRFLQILSERLRLCLRDEDTIARLGGDEFAVILEDMENAGQAANVARKVLDTLSKPFLLDELELFITASIGISLFPNDGSDSQTLLKNADIAMYRSKDLGRNTYHFYSEDMSSKAFERLSFETSLRHALDREEFILYYQPQIDIISGRMVGAEALIRWQHPDLGLVSPADFIHILEETGLIIEVGEWVLQQACHQAKEWNKLGSPLFMSVNVSTRQFSSPGFCDTVNHVLRDTSLDSSLLELEITESILLQKTPDILHTFEKLLKTNIQIALDDFGTGYSSLSYLKRFPVNVLKIDRTFVRDITTDPDDASIIEAILALAKSLKLDVVAEGVENKNQQDFLLQRGCNIMQGFYLSPPLPAEKITDLLM